MDRVYERQVRTLECYSSGSETDDDLDLEEDDYLAAEDSTDRKRRPRDEETGDDEEQHIFDIDADLPQRPRTTRVSLINGKRKATSGRKQTTAVRRTSIDLIDSETTPAAAAALAAAPKKTKRRTDPSAASVPATPRKTAATQVVVYDGDGRPILPLSLGVLTLLELGRVVTDRPEFHNKRYIWPVGFHSMRSYLSTVHPDQQTIYHSRILDPRETKIENSASGDSGPLFVVTAEDNAEAPFRSNTSTGAWSAIVKLANQIRGRDGSNSASGPDFFGLSNHTIAMLIEGLPGVEQCSQYQRRGVGVLAPPPPPPMSIGSVLGDDTQEDGSFHPKPLSSDQMMPESSEEIVESLMMLCE